MFLAQEFPSSWLSGEGCCCHMKPIFIGGTIKEVTLGGGAGTESCLARSASGSRLCRSQGEQRSPGQCWSGDSSNTGGLPGNPLPLQKNVSPVCGASCSKDPLSGNAVSGSIWFSLLRRHCCPGLFDSRPVFQNVDLLQHVYNVWARNERCLLPLAGWQ